MAEGQKSKIWGLGRPMCAGARVRGNSMLGARKGRKEPFGRFPGRQNAAAEHLGEIRSDPQGGPGGPRPAGSGSIVGFFATKVPLGGRTARNSKNRKNSLLPNSL